MYDLFEKYPDEIHIYTHRWPKPDGGTPTLNRPILAVAVMLSCGVVVWGTLHFGIDGQPIETLLAKCACYILAALYALWFLVKQFFKVVVTANGDIYVDRILYRRRIASLADLTDIRIMDYEWNGRLHYHYVGLWKKDRLSTPLRLSPTCLTVNQLSHFRRTVIPSVRKFHPAYDLSKGEWSGWPDPPAAPPAPPPGRPGPGGDNRLGVSFWVANLASILRVGVTLSALVFLVWQCGNGMRVYGDYGLAANGLRLLYPVAALVAVVYFLRHLRIVAQRHMTVVIDGDAETVETTTVFGSTRNLFTFESLEDINVKYIGGRRYICLMFQNNMVDPVVAVAHTSDGTRRELRRICDALKLNDMNAWVMQLEPPDKYRHRNFKDPYREPEEGLKSRFKQ